MSSTVTCSCTPRLGSFVVEIPSMTWSYSGFTEMGCYKPSPATWMVGLSIDGFFCTFCFTSPWRYDSEMLWKWMLVVLSNSLIFAGPLSVFGSAACFHDVFCRSFLANYCGNWNGVTVKVGGSTPQGARMPVQSPPGLLPFVSGESLETFTSNC